MTLVNFLLKFINEEAESTTVSERNKTTLDVKNLTKTTIDEGRF